MALHTVTARIRATTSTALSGTPRMVTSTRATAAALTGRLSCVHYTRVCVSLYACLCVSSCVLLCARGEAAYAHHVMHADPRELPHARTDNMRQRKPKNAGRATTGRPEAAPCQAAWSSVKLRHPTPGSAREADRGDGRLSVAGSCWGMGGKRGEVGVGLAWLCVRRASDYLF